MGLLLYIISYFLELPIYFINFLTVLWVHRKKHSFLKTINGYFFSGAVSRDKFGNYNYRTGLNFWLIKKNAYQFGNKHETISSVLGKNEILKTLTIFGWFWVYFLWVVDYRYWRKGGHCKNSIK
jgi:hypothetical protein